MFRYPDLVIVAAATGAQWGRCCSVYLAYSTVPSTGHVELNSGSISYRKNRESTVQHPTGRDISKLVSVQ